MFTQTRIVMLSVLFASTIGCAETTGESDGSVSSDPQTVTDGAGSTATCGGPGPFYDGGPPDEADILEVTATPGSNTLKVEITYGGNAQMASESPGRAYGMVAKATDDTTMDVLQREGGWKVVDGVASIQGMWAAEDKLVLELSDMPGPPARVATSTFGSTDGEYWCDRVIITF